MEGVGEQDRGMGSAEGKGPRGAEAEARHPEGGRAAGHPTKEVCTLPP